MVKLVYCAFLIFTVSAIRAEENKTETENQDDVEFKSNFCGTCGGSHGGYYPYPQLQPQPQPQRYNYPSYVNPYPSNNIQYPYYYPQQYPQSGYPQQQNYPVSYYPQPIQFPQVYPQAYPQTYPQTYSPATQPHSSGGQYYVIPAQSPGQSNGYPYQFQSLSGQSVGLPSNSWSQFLGKGVGSTGNNAYADIPFEYIDIDPNSVVDTSLTHQEVTPETKPVSQKNSTSVTTVPNGVQSWQQYLPQNYDIQSLPMYGVGSNDPYAKIPTQVIDVDANQLFRNGIFKPVVKVDSQSEHVTIKPITMVKSSIVTLKPIHATITRVLSGTQTGEDQEITLDFYNGEQIKKTEDENSNKVDETVGEKEENEVQTESNIDNAKDQQTTEVNAVAEEESNEEPDNVNSWFF